VFNVSKNPHEVRFIYRLSSLRIVPAISLKERDSNGNIFSREEVNSRVVFDSDSVSFDDYISYRSWVSSFSLRNKISVISEISSIAIQQISNKRTWSSPVEKLAFSRIIVGVEDQQFGTIGFWSHNNIKVVEFR